MPMKMGIHLKPVGQRMEPLWIPTVAGMTNRVNLSQLVWLWLYWLAQDGQVPASWLCGMSEMPMLLGRLQVFLGLCDRLLATKSGDR